MTKWRNTFVYWNFLYLYLFYIFNRPGVAGAVLKSPLLLINSFSQSVSHPFPPNLQDTFTSKPYELGTWNFERMFTSLNVSDVTCHLSCVTCQMSHVTCHVSHVCYQQALPRLVLWRGKINFGLVLIYAVNVNVWACLYPSQNLMIKKKLVATTRLRNMSKNLRTIWTNQNQNRKKGKYFILLSQFVRVFFFFLWHFLYMSMHKRIKF